MDNSDFSSGAGMQKRQDESKNDKNMDSLMKELFEIAQGETTDRSIPDVYNRMLDKVRVQMVTKDGNSERLAEVPHIDMLDMAAVFRVVLPGDESTVSPAVTNSLLRRFNVTPEKFRQDALKAAEVNNPVRIEGLGNVLSGLENREDDPYSIGWSRDPLSIKQPFDYLKNSVSTSASHAHTDEYFRGWAFLNHVSLLYYYGLLNALRNTKLDEKYSAEDVLKLTKNIYQVNTGGAQGRRISAIQKRTQDVLDTLGVDLLRKN